MATRNRNLMSQAWGPEEIVDLIENLESWAAARDSVNRRKDRKGRPLDSQPLHDAAGALAVLHEYQTLYPEFFKWADRNREVPHEDGLLAGDAPRTTGDLDYQGLEDPEGG